MTCKISVKCINGRYPAVPPSPRMNLFKTEGAKEHLTRLLSTLKGDHRPLLAIPNGHRHRNLFPTSPFLRSIIQTLNIILPLLHIHTIDSPIIRHQSVNLALYIRRLRVDCARAGVQFNLLL